MSPYREAGKAGVVLAPYKLKKPLWLTMLIAIVLVVTCVVTMIAASSLCLRAMS